MSKRKKIAENRSRWLRKHQTQAWKLVAIVILQTSFVIQSSYTPPASTNVLVAARATGLLFYRLVAIESDTTVTMLRRFGCASRSNSTTKTTSSDEQGSHEGDCRLCFCFHSLTSMRKITKTILIKSRASSFCCHYCIVSCYRVVSCALILVVV